MERSGDIGAPRASATVDLFGLVGTRLEGKYDVEAAIAEGGFAVVYRGLHRTLQKAVALKVLKVPDHLSDGALRAFMAKFEEEARTIARIEHPAIVRVLDSGASTMPDGRQAPWMALEWLEGVTLDVELAARPQGRSPAEVLALMLPAFEALAYAHEEGVAHRDIKPANLFLARDRRGAASLRVLDFGIAKMVDGGERSGSGHTATQAAFRAFSPEYAAPEQVSGTRTGPWTDVHALALITVEALTGRPPYARHDPTALFADVLSPVRPTPARFGVDVGAWEPVLKRALAVMAPDRHPNARALLDDLRASLPASSHVIPPTRVSYTPAPAGLPLAAPTVAMTAIAPPSSLPSPQPQYAPRPAVGNGALVTGIIAVGLLAIVGVWWLARPASNPTVAEVAPAVIAPPVEIAPAPPLPAPPPVAMPEPEPINPVAPIPVAAGPARRRNHAPARRSVRSSNGTVLLSPD